MKVDKRRIQYCVTATVDIWYNLEYSCCFVIRPSDAIMNEIRNSIEDIHNKGLS